MVRRFLDQLLQWPHLPAAVVLLAGCVTAAALGGMPFVTAVELWLPGLAMIAQGISLIARRKFPLWTLAGCVGLDALVIVVTDGETGSGALGVIIASYSLVRVFPTARSAQYLGAAALFSVVVSSIALVQNSEFTDAFAVGVSVVRVFVQNVVPAVVADATATRAQLVRAYRDRIEHAERGRQAAIDRALQGERTALARELHDIAAHHLTGIVVTIQAASVLLRTDRSAEAGKYLTTALGEANRTLDQLRATVGLLRDDNGNEATLSPTLDDIGELVSAVRTRGISIDYDCDSSTPSEMVKTSPTERVTVFRMIQESLANVIRHAPNAACSVQITSQRGRLTVTVINDPPPGSPPDHNILASASGLGLIGMHERAHLIGADLKTEPTSRGGWQNRLVVRVGGHAR
ncbi:MAG: sensor histidine kinase [Rhodococcus sp. (in: high G+C Gram-positive bacteria)]